MDTIRKLILQDHPDYDFNRYRFQPGDYITTQSGSRVLVEYSALDYISGYVLSRSLVYRSLGQSRIQYTDLPYFNKEEFVNRRPTINKTLKWNLFDFVHLDDGDMLVLLTECVGHQEFIAFVLQSENSYYLHTHIYVRNPYRDYVAYGF